MIDAETEIYDAVVEYVEDHYPELAGKINWFNDYVQTAEVFPAVTLVERENRTHQQAQTNENVEEMAVLDYEANIYTNTMENRKQDARLIALAIDEAFQHLKFRRRMLSQIPNIGEASIFRMQGRWSVRIDKDHGLSRRP